MLSLSNSFIFVHVPKTAGNAIQSVLVDYSEDEIVCSAAHHDGIERFEVRNNAHGFSKHTPLGDYEKHLGREQVDRLFTFACVRNPWERLVSFYFSPHRKVKEWNREAFVKFVSEVPLQLSYLQHRDTDIGEVDTGGKKSQVDFLLRYETLQCDFNTLCRNIGIPKRTLPHRNRSIRKPYQAYYDDELRGFVEARHRSDIEAFEYSFDRC